jgi:predicted DNA-binding transcriptional regulator AlpA
MSEFSQIELNTTAVPQNLMQLAQLLEKLLEKTELDTDERLWTPADVANFLQVSEASVMKNYFYMPDFPKGFRLPSKKGMGSRRWYARDIKQWCERQKSF